MANYDLTIVSSKGSITFFGQKIGSKSTENPTGYSSSLDFLGLPKLRSTTQPKMNADGGLMVATDQNLDARTPSIDAWAICRNNEEKIAILDSFRKSFPIRENVMLFVSTPDGKKFGLQCGILTATSDVKFSDGKNIVIDFAIDLFAGDPFWRDYTFESPNEVPINKQVSGGLQWTSAGLAWLSDGLHWSSGSGNTVIVNGGAETVYPTITIDGVVHNPSIQNIDTGQTFSLNISTNDSDKIVIDMDNETVTLNGSNITNNISSGDWWGLKPGNTQIGYTTANGNDTASVMASWRDLFTEAW